MKTRRPTTRGSLILLVLAIVSMGAFLAARPQSAAAASTNVTVVIERFVEVQNPDPQVGQGCCGDYYGRVQIAGLGFDKTGSIDDKADVSPYWRFTKSVDDSLGTIPIQIQVWDEDSALAAPDDIMDLNPTDGVQTLTVLFNLQTGTWSGDVPANVGFSQGDGDHNQFNLTEGGEAGKVLFDISLSLEQRRHRRRRDPRRRRALRRARHERQRRRRHGRHGR